MNRAQRPANAASAEELLGPSLTGRASLLDAFKPYLESRIAEGVTATAILLDEIKARGYRGCERTLRRWLVDARAWQQKPPPSPPVPSSRTITSWIMRPEHKLSEDDKAALKDACARCPEIAELTELAHGLACLVRQRQGDQLEHWIGQACDGSLSEMRSFANGLRKDFDAVKARLTLAWSSGAVEGGVNSIKMLKRQMFGRANFDLLPANPARLTIHIGRSTNVCQNHFSLSVDSNLAEMRQLDMRRLCE